MHFRQVQASESVVGKRVKFSVDGPGLRLGALVVPLALKSLSRVAWFILVNGCWG